MRNQKFLQILLHIIGCLLFLALPIFTSPDFPQSASTLVNTPTQRDLLGYLLMICFFYLNFFLLIPKFYFRRKFAKFLGVILLCFVAVSTIPHLIIPEKQFHEPMLKVHSSNRPPPAFQNYPPPDDKMSPPPEMNNNPAPSEHTNNYIFTVIRYLFIFLALVFFSLILQVNNRLKLAEKDKLDTELRFLKAQINPHFLFNSLNTIYSLSVTEKSINTSSAIIRLSEMMRYVINDTSKDFVLLKDEINHINNYISFQKLRFDDLVDIRFQQQGNTTGKKIAPLILIPFIENAFKYGVDAQQKNIININIDVNNTNLHLLLINKKVNMHPVESSGVGLSNTQSRLQLLYSSKHELVIKDEEDFSVSLTLVLS